MRAGWPCVRRVALVPMLLIGGPALAQVTLTQVALAQVPLAPVTLAQATRPWTDPPATLSPGNVPDTASVEGVERQASPEPGAADVGGATPPAAEGQVPPAGIEAAGPRRAAPSSSPEPAVAMATGALRGRPAYRRAGRAEVAWRFAVDYLDQWSGPNHLAVDTAQDFYGPKVLFHGRVMSPRDLFDEKRRFVQRWPVRHYRHRPALTTVACEPGGQSCTVRSIFDFTAVSPQRGRRSDGIGALDLVVRFVGGRPVIAEESSRVLARFPRVS